MGHSPFRLFVGMLIFGSEKVPGFVVRFSLVWLSKVGLVTRQFMRTLKWFSTCTGLAFFPPLYFFLTTYRLQMFDEFVGNAVNVTSALGCDNSIEEGYLLKTSSI